MGIAETVMRVRTLATRAVGAVAALVGLLLVGSSVPPQDGEAVVILALGVVVLLGVVIVKNPYKVVSGRRRRDDDELELDADGDRRRDQRFR